MFCEHLLDIKRYNAIKENTSNVYVVEQKIIHININSYVYDFIVGENITVSNVWEIFASVWEIK